MSRTLPLLLLLAIATPQAVGGQEPPAPEAPRPVVRPVVPDFERAFDAVRRGEIRPLAEILPGIEARFGGRAIEMELETDEGRWIYDIEILAADGRLFEVDVDAVTGEILDVEEEVD